MTDLYLSAQLQIIQHPTTPSQPLFLSYLQNSQQTDKST